MEQAMTTTANVKKYFGTEFNKAVPWYTTEKYETMGTVS
jgi:hypothetical protein